MKKSKLDTSPVNASARQPTSRLCCVHVQPSNSTYLYFGQPCGYGPATPLVPTHCCVLSNLHAHT